jgi:hypothetical protein
LSWGNDLLSTKSVGEVSSSEHSQRLRHLRESLPVRNDFGTNRWSAIDGGVSHLIDEGLHRYDISRDLLLELSTVSTLYGCLKQDRLTPSFIAAQLRIMQKTIAFQKTLAASHRPRALNWLSEA